MSLTGSFDDAHLLAASAILVLAGYVVSLILARHTLVGRSECPYELADVYFHFVFVPLVLLLVVRALLELTPLGVEARWHRSTMESRAFLALYVAQSSAHIGILYLKRQVGSPAAYVAHHVLSVACYGHALWTGRMHFWAVLAALCEVTNIFLNNLFLFRTLKWDRTFGLVYKANGVLLWLSYVLFRLVLFPVWLALFARDVTNRREVTWTRVNAFERCAYPITTILLFVISSFWFAKITAGLINAIRGSPSDDKRAGSKGAAPSCSTDVRASPAAASKKSD
jgi:hypothetical protein